VDAVNGFLSWWDGVELWLSGLPFVLQALAVMPIVLAIAYSMATLLDALLGKGTQLLRRARESVRESVRQSGQASGTRP
jgi:hypothetical protein